MKKINIDFKVEKNGKLVKVQSEESVPTKTSELENDSGFITQAPETAIDNQTITKNSTNELQTIGVKYNDNLITAEMIYNATHYIRYKDVGLYVDGVLTKTWEQLITDGDVTVANGWLKVANKNLAGDLVCDKVEGLINLRQGFVSCQTLTNIDVSKLDTSNVTNMVAMFRQCIKLTSLNLSNLNTSNVTEMTSMFFNCSALKTLNISNFNTNNVTDMGNMFGSCSSLTSLNVSNFNTSKVKDMSGMFRKCNELTSLDLLSFNTSNVTHMNFMFRECSGLTSLDLSNFNTTNVTSMTGMFYGCFSLTNLDISNFTFDKVTSYGGMFDSVTNNCEILVKSQTEKDWITSKFTNLTNVQIKGGEEITDLAGTTWQFKDTLDTSMITGTLSGVEASLNLAGDTREFKSITLHNNNTSPVKAMITDNSWEKTVTYTNSWSSSSTTATLPPKVTFNVYNKALYDNAQQWEEFIAFLKANATQEV